MFKAKYFIGLIFAAWVGTASAQVVNPGLQAGAPFVIGQCLQAGPGVGQVTTMGTACSAGGVTSFNARAGAVVPALNDYNFNQISGALGCSQMPSLSSDLTNAACVVTLATVNANVGTFGNATGCVTVTANAKGLITGISATTCTPAFSSLTGTASLAQGGLGGSQAGATINQIPVFPGGGGAAVPTSQTTWFDNAYCNTAGYIIARLLNQWTCDRSIPINVKWLGAAGNGIADDTASLATAFAAAVAGNSRVWVPDGTYCVKTGPVGPTSGHIVIEGSSWLGASLNACGANNTVLQLGGGSHVVKNLNVFGYSGSDVLSTSHAIHVLNTCGDCVLSRLYVLWGYYPIQNEGVDLLISDNLYAANGYGPAVVHNNNNALWMIRAKIDQSWPVSYPSAPLAINAWAAATGYTAGTSVIQVNGFTFQCSQTGTSGGVFPAGPYTYGVPIVDNTARWNLVSAWPNYMGLHIDGGSSEVHVIQSDFTGSYITASIGINTANGGAAPFLTTITDSVLSQSWGSTIDVVAGSRLILKGNEIAGCLQAGCASVALRSAWAGDASIVANYIWGAPNGVYIASGVNNIVANNLIGATSTGIMFDSAVNYFNALGNAKSIVGGNCNINVTTAGSNHYNIVNQIGCTITDSGTGPNKTVTANN